MEKTHETELTDSKVNVDQDEVYSPIKDLQKMEGVSSLSRNSLDLNKQPKGIRFLGYFFITFIVISTIVVLIANLFLN